LLDFHSWKQIILFYNSHKTLENTRCIISYYQQAGKTEDSDESLFTI